MKPLKTLKTYKEFLNEPLIESIIQLNNDTIEILYVISKWYWMEGKDPDKKLKIWNELKKLLPKVPDEYKTGSITANRAIMLNKKQKEELRNNGEIKMPAKVIISFGEKGRKFNEFYGRYVFYKKYIKSSDVLFHLYRYTRDAMRSINKQIIYPLKYKGNIITKSYNGPQSLLANVNNEREILVKNNEIYSTFNKNDIIEGI